jgi:hypothetical protein
LRVRDVPVAVVNGQGLRNHSAADRQVTAQSNENAWPLGDGGENDVIEIAQ